MRTGSDVCPKPHGDLPKLTVARGDDPRVLQINFRQFQRGSGVFHIRLQRVAVNNHGLQILARHVQRRLGLIDIRAALRRAGEGGVTLSNRQ